MIQEYLLTVNGLGKKYGQHWAVRGVSFCLEQGDVLGIVGENGAGKSTLLSMIATLQKKTEGSILFEGREIGKSTREYLKHIGYVPQEIALFEELSGHDNLDFFAKSYAIPKDRIKDRIQRICEITSFPTEWLKRPVSEYSGGMKRKLNIGAALLHTPSLLLLDEPTVNLDFGSEEQILSAIRTLSGEGVTVIYVGHQMEITEQLCNKLCFLKHGEQLLFETTRQALTGDRGEVISLRERCRRMEQMTGNR